jgi:hypothetical protein
MRLGQSLYQLFLNSIINRIQEFIKELMEYMILDMVLAVKDGMFKNLVIDILAV